jgi:mono/diheme cytochrome c family protein
MAAAALAGWSLMGGLRPVAAQAGAGTPAFYTEKVRPIFVASCAQCHLGINHKGGLSLETKAATLKGGRDGVVIVPGDPASSLLVKLIRHEGPPDDPMPMPQRADKLSDVNIAIVEQWVKAGAAMPDDAPKP